MYYLIHFVSDFPNLKAFSTGELRFIERKVDNRELKRPADIISGHLHMPSEVNKCNLINRNQ